ncbi:MAG: hypothetical protein MI975_08160 [Cytophagales bacterium]|nr:hypothetical protein [Cytophagales bacterium]
MPQHINMIKAHLILGFLGSGKTTFLKQVLKKPELKNDRILLVVNDYGLENYDARELGNDAVEVTGITNGCLCCSYKNQFEEILIQCAAREDIDRIFIEPSGLFIPDQVLNAFDREPVKSVINLEPITCIVDYHLLSKLWPPAIERLIEAGQIIVRNKLDKVSAEARKHLDERIKELNDHELIDFNEAVESFFCCEASGSRSFFDHESEYDHGIRFIQKFAGLEFRNHDELFSFLTKQNPNLIRAKGNVQLNGQLTFINFANTDLTTHSSDGNGKVGLSCFYFD